MFTKQSSICVIRREKLNSFGWHYGVALPDGRIVDLNIDSGVRLIDAETFAQNKDVETVREVARDKFPTVHRRLNEALSAPPKYDLLTMNCEDFANWLTGEHPISGQVVFWGLAVIGLAGAAFN